MPNQLDWSKYAEKYDMLLAYNPFYQDLHQEVLNLCSNWDIEPGDRMVDIGAGTGNYSIELAKKFPHARVVHVDRFENRLGVQGRLAFGILLVRRRDRQGDLASQHHVDEGPLGEVLVEPARAHDRPVGLALLHGATV